MKTRVAVALLVLFQAVGGARAADDFPKPQDRVLSVYLTAAPPKIDGSMDDPCWAGADAAKDFSLFKMAGKPTQQTEVRLLYDAGNLYVFWTLHEARMDTLAVGAAEDARDFIQWNDAPELFLDPGRTEKDYYHFVTTPLAARYDSSTRSGTHFNPAWTAASGRFPGGWTVEARIPFGQLAEAGFMSATPRVGDRWGVSFCRNQGSLHEWSQWVPTSQGFHEPKNFGSAVFRGPKAGGAGPAVTAADPGPLFYGPGELRFSVAGAAGPLEGVCTLFHEGKKVGDLPAAGTKDGIRFSYRLLDAGAFRMSFALLSGGAVFHAGEAAAFLPPTRAVLETMEREIREGAAALKKLGNRHPEFPGLARRVAAFDRRSAGVRGRVARAAELTAAEWRDLVAEADRLSADWKALRFDINLARLYPGKSAASPELFALGAESESGKIYPDTVYRGSLTAPVALALAGREYGSYQLAVLPFWKDVPVESVSFTPLVGPSGRRIPAGNCRWARVGYVRLKGVDPKNLSAHEYEPDPLLPPGPFTVKAGTVGAVWVDVRLPSGLPSGLYRGSVSVTAGGRTASRPVEVRSYGFDIPERPSVETDFWFSVYQWNNFYKPLSYTPELHAKHAEVIGRHRVSSIPNDWITLCRQVPIFVEPDGRFTFDWAPLDAYIRNGLKNGSTAFWSALSCNSGWTAWMNNPGVQVTERATGKKVPLGNYIKGKSQYENPAYRDFLVAYTRHLKDLGIAKNSYYELFDEPNDNSRWLAMIEHHTFFKKVVPDLQLLCFGIDPTQVKAGKSAVGLIDAWAPHLTHLDEKVHAAILERRAKFGEKYWMYTCGEGTDKDGNYSPFCKYERPYMAVRMHAWMAWRLGVDGFLIFAMSGVPEENIKADPAQRWPNGDWSDGGWRGCGTLVYPGPDYALIPGMRLANAREGLEDYEYFAVLRNEAKRLDPVRHAALARRVAAALVIEPEIVSSVYVWTKDPARLEAKRASLASLIREVRAAK